MARRRQDGEAARERAIEHSRRMLERYRSWGEPWDGFARFERHRLRSLEAGAITAKRER